MEVPLVDTDTVTVTVDEGATGPTTAPSSASGRGDQAGEDGLPPLQCQECGHVIEDEEDDDEPEDEPIVIPVEARLISLERQIEALTGYAVRTNGAVAQLTRDRAEESSVVPPMSDLARGVEAIAQAILRVQEAVLPIRDRDRAERERLGRWAWEVASATFDLWTADKGDDGMDPEEG